MTELVQADVSVPPVALPVAEPAEPRWPGIVAMFTALWMPAKTARRTQHVPLMAAFGVHFLAALLASMVMIVLVAWAESSYQPKRGFGAELNHICGEIIDGYCRELMRWPLEILAATVGIFLLIEGSFVALGLLLSPWGAVDERLRSSMANGLRQVWLHTGDAIPVFVLVGCVMIPLSQAQRDWWSQENAMSLYSNPPMPPTPPANAAPNSKEWQDYQQKMQEYSQATTAYYAAQSKVWEERYSRRPWLVRNADTIMAATCTCSGVWVLWAMLSAVGARRRVVPTARPPICEECGYNLTTMPLEARCPECGVPVANSLGPMARPGAPWEFRRQLGRRRAWMRTALDALTRPHWLGMQVRVATRQVEHRSFLLMVFPVLWVIGYLMMIGMLWRDFDNRYQTRDELVFGIAPVIGVMVASLGIVGPLGGTCLIGLITSLGHKRNLVPAAMQVAVYMSGVLVLFAFLSAALGAVMVQAAEHRWLRGLRDLWHIDDEAIAFFGWALPTLVMMVAYLVLLYRGTRGARYANR